MPSLRVLLACATLGPVLAAAQATVTVDPFEAERPISPLVYGVNQAGADALAAGNLALTVWGGRQGARYNWRTDVANPGRGDFFMNVPACFTAARGFCDPAPANPEEDSAANRILADAAAAGAAILFTVPSMGHVPAGPPVYAQPFPCGCPTAAVPGQATVDPTGTCGQGRDATGAALACPNPTTTTSIAIDASFVREWVRAIVARFGPSGGRRIYLVDDEPALWHRTHGDAHPAPATAAEVWTKFRATAEAVLDEDPTARVGAFSEWAWPNYLCSAADTALGPCTEASPERAARGGMPLVAWFLEQARDHELRTGRRILHLLDLHFYAQAGTPPDTVRALWDPAWIDPSWNETIRLLPRMRAWVDTHYPGTGIGLSDYAFYAHDARLGAVAYAVALGVLGREGADVAAATHVVRPGKPPFAAFRLFRDPDGEGCAFEATSVAADVAGDAAVHAFAAKGSGRVTIALANAAAAPRDVDVAVSHLVPAGDARVFQLSASGTAIDRGADVAFVDGRARVTLDATSIAMVVVHGTFEPPPPPPPPPEEEPIEAGPSGCGCASAAPDGALVFALLAAATRLGRFRRRGARPPVDPRAS